MAKQVISTNNSTTAQKAKSKAAKSKTFSKPTAATPSASASAYKRSTTIKAKPLFRFTVTQSKCTHCGTIKPAASEGTHSGKWRVRIIAGDEVSAGECRGCNKRGWGKTGAKSFYVEGATRGEYGEAKAKIAEYLGVGREMVVLAGSPDPASSAVGVAVASNRNVDNAMWNGQTGVCSSYHPSQWHNDCNHRPMAYANTGDNRSQQPMSTFDMSIANILFSDHNNFATECTALNNPTFANTASSIMSTSSSAKTLTEEQRKRMETNRQRALQRKRRNADKMKSPLDQSLHSFGDNSTAANLHRRSSSNASHRSAPRYNPTNYDSALYQPLSQESTITTSSSDANNPTNRKPSFNPYTSRRSVSNTTVIPDTKTQLSGMSDEQAEASIPPLPEDAPPLRELTVQMLSEQQLEVVELARPPTANGDDLCTGSSANDEGNEHDNNTYDNPPMQPQGYIVRLTACAGAGKTTNLLHLALRCKDLGHKNLTYVTFSKASAKDAEDRITALMTEENNQASAINDVVITASTLHSCAMRALMGNDDCDEDQDKSLLSEEAFMKLFREEFDNEIRRYLTPAIRHIHDTVEPKKRKARERTLREQVLFYLKKTFRHFCTSKMSLETFREEEDNSRWSWSPRHYFPVTKDFQMNGKAEKLGFPSSMYSSRKSYRFYADLCAQFWDLVDERGVRTFDIMMKKAQLKGVRIPCTVLLVDECQDLDACQVDWIATQKDYGTQIFFVGDAAQTIYSFRGAKSSNVMSIPGCVDRLLTKSWRFGPAIARVANIALFVKEHCPQTTNYEGKTKKLWNPYRVEGSRGEDESEVVAKSLMTDWKKNKPIALIGRTNGSLIIEALALMGLSSLQQQGGNDDTVSDNSSYNDEELERDNFDVDSILRLTEIPKFHIHGRGESSGIKRWRTSMSQIEHLYDLYMAKEGGGSLPRDMFPEFSEDSHITWDSFLEAFVARELTKYSQAVQLIITYKKNTIKAIHIFQAKVMSQMYSMEEADIILTTCHASKGLEFDNVELCNDFLNVSKASYSCDVREDHRHPAFLCPTTSEHPGSKKRRFGWQFNLNSYGDDLNLLYVACTRAKKTLSLPESFKSILSEFDLYHHLVGDIKRAAASKTDKKPCYDEETTIILGKEKLKKGQLWELYYDLCNPLRRELGVSDDCMIMKELFSIDIEQPVVNNSANGSDEMVIEC